MPYEVLLRICGHLEHVGTSDHLAALSTTCRALSQPAQEQLFERVKFNLYDESTVHRSALQLADLPKGLRNVHGASIYLPDSTTPLRGTIALVLQVAFAMAQLHRTLTRITITSLARDLFTCIADLLRRCTHVQELDLQVVCSPGSSLLWLEECLREQTACLSLSLDCQSGSTFDSAFDSDDMEFRPSTAPLTHLKSFNLNCEKRLGVDDLISSRLFQSLETLQVDVYSVADIWFLLTRDIELAPIPNLRQLLIEVPDDSGPMRRTNEMESDPRSFTIHFVRLFPSLSTLKFSIPFHLDGVPFLFTDLPYSLQDLYVEISETESTDADALEQCLTSLPVFLDGATMLRRLEVALDVDWGLEEDVMLQELEYDWEWVDFSVLDSDDENNYDLRYFWDPNSERDDEFSEHLLEEVAREQTEDRMSSWRRLCKESLRTADRIMRVRGAAVCIDHAPYDW